MVYIFIQIKNLDLMNKKNKNKNIIYAVYNAYNES